MISEQDSNTETRGARGVRLSVILQLDWYKFEPLLKPCFARNFSSPRGQQPSPGSCSIFSEIAYEISVLTIRFLMDFWRTMVFSIRSIERSFYCLMLYFFVYSYFRALKGKSIQTTKLATCGMLSDVMVKIVFNFKTKTLQVSQ